MHGWSSSLCLPAAPKPRWPPRTATYNPARPRELCRKAVVSRSPGCSGRLERRTPPSAAGRLELRQIVTMNSLQTFVYHCITRHARSINTLHAAVSRDRWKLTFTLGNVDAAEGKHEGGRRSHPRCLWKFEQRGRMTESRVWLLPRQMAWLEVFSFERKFEDKEKR